MSGFIKVVPPPVANRKLPGEIAVPSGLKKIFRGPSELKNSFGFALPVKGRVPVRALSAEAGAGLKPARTVAQKRASGRLTTKRTLLLSLGRACTG